MEELSDLHCAVVVCQRVEPDCRWEDIIVSLRPKLVLQEDLHGCERQQLRGHGYVRTWIKARQYGLQPFRPWPIFPGNEISSFGGVKILMMRRYKQAGGKYSGACGSGL